MAEQYDNYDGTSSPGRNIVVREPRLEEEASKKSWSWAGSRNSSGSLDRDMEQGGVFTNQVPFIIPVDCELRQITMATDGVETWEAHVYKNGVSVASLAATAETKKSSGLLSVSFSAGDEVRLRQVNGVGSINMPRITAFFKEI